MTRYTVTFVAVAFAAGGWGGFLLGSRSQREPPAATPSGPEVEAELPAAIPAAAGPRASGDCQNIQNQLALCMAYHPAPSEAEKFLAMCRAELDICRDKPNLPACWDFIDLAPVYDRMLGEVDPSPETIERAKHLTVDDCAEIIGWAERAGIQQGTCLKGRSEPPPGFKEKYGHPITERPLFKACKGTAAVNAFLRREAQRGGGGHPLHIGGKRDGWRLVYRLPDGTVIRPGDDDPDASAP